MDAMFVRLFGKMDARELQECLCVAKHNLEIFIACKNARQVRESRKCIAWTEELIERGC